uniref:Uncharacterized protein n=1 Tax=viral metagenome TaxID=1070528 RepID=A0A6C0CSY2_9ZZZZ
MNDLFGIRQLYPSTSNVTFQHDWYSQWHVGETRTKTFGPAGTLDPDLIFRGSGLYVINGSSTDPLNRGTLCVSGACPRIYVRNSNLNNSFVSPNTTKSWKNTETTVYVNTINPGLRPVYYAGVQISQRTDHFPDTDLCCTRGIGSKWNFDGRCMCEKETVHLNDGSGNKQSDTVFPFLNQGPMPLNTWIGYKSVCRSCENDTKCRVDMYLDTTNGMNGGRWILCHSFTDYDDWSSDYPTCCEAHRGNVLGRNYTTYLRTDGILDQRYKWFSVREIDPLP